jgi:hypothetical protein
MKVLKLYARRYISLITGVSKRVIHTAKGRQFVHFLHIGKTGGSAIKYALKLYSSNARYAIYIHNHNFILRDVPKGEGVVFFLRDPIERFISGFYSRQRQGQPKFFFPWSSGEKDAFEYFNTPNDLAITLSSQNREKKYRAQKAMKSIAHIKDIFWKWFESEEYLKSRMSDIFFIGFQERLFEDFEILKSKLALPDSIMLPRDEIQAHKNPDHLNKNLNEKAVENLKNWYKEDYKVIRICKEIIENQDLGCTQ